MTAQIQKRFASLIEPPARLKPSEFAEQFIVLPDEGNAEPGKYRLARMPWQQAMLDDPTDPSVSEVFWQMCSQYSGKTLCIGILAAYVMKVLKRSLILSRDTKDHSLQWLRSKFIPMIAATPAMQGVMYDPRKRGSDSTAMFRRFLGGVFTMIGANSVGAFRGTTAWAAFQDEVDAYEDTKEGDACALIDRATKTFPDAWKVKCSTPTLVGFSRINRGFESGDKQYYFVPCHHCGEFQSLKFRQIKFSFTKEEHERFAGATGVHQALDSIVAGAEWETGAHPVRDTAKALYVCEHCKHGWTDRQRIAAIKSGHADNPAITVNGKELRAHWKATAPFNGIRSRHLSGMYGMIGLGDAHVSYLHRWAEEFLEAKRGGRETLMAWTNMFDNEPFEDEYEKLDWKEVKKRAEDYGPDLPPQVLWICWAADVHPDRVETIHYGFGPDNEAWALEYHVMFGDFDMPAMQERVFDYLSNKRFKHPILGDMASSSGGMDSGHQTKVKAVFRFCGRHRLRNWFAVKGFDSALGSLLTTKRDRIYGCVILNLNGDALKNTLFDMLKNTEPGPNYIHFPKEMVTGPDGKTFRTRFSDVFYQQLFGEKKVTRQLANGATQTAWVKHTSWTRNEALDVSYYALGVYELSRARESLARKWKEIEPKVREMFPPAPVAEKPAEVTTEIKQPEMRPTIPNRRPIPRRRIRIASPFGGFRRF